jgi:hypothetical protein
MDLGATKHMTPHRAAFDMYEVIPTRNVHMGDDSIVEAIGMGIFPPYFHPPFFYFHFHFHFFSFF